MRVLHARAAQLRGAPCRGPVALRALAQRVAVPPRPSTSRLLRTERGDAEAPARDEHAVVREVRRAAAEHALLRPGDAVVACVSGGADSCALLLALADLAPEWRLRLHVLHFNHGLRVRPGRGY